MALHKRGLPHTSVSAKHQLERRRRVGKGMPC
jgi:hypothetical protein